LSQLYAAVARERRRWYARRPDRRRRLDRPVVSVGNVAVGGSGKTPLVAHLARLLQDAGHRPSILTRGYARARSSDGVTVVSDGERILADLDRAGDEPLMLARRLPGVPVLVSSERYLSGRLAERRFGSSVHLLDDGFQHFQLDRDVDLVVVSGADLARAGTLPFGRLREPLDVLRAASAVVLANVEPAEDEATVRALGALGVETIFRLARESGSPQPIDEGDRFEPPAAGTQVLGVAGLARPERFFADVGRRGWTVAGTLAFRDHYRYTRSDLAGIAAAMRGAGASLVVTTEKDVVRMLPLRPLPVPVAWLPLSVRVEPEAEFAAWLAGLLGIRRGGGEAGRRDEHAALRPPPSACLDSA
jgi:tetraacyldisaccharide 4'-kinase